jgi:hypothetical protein
MFIGLKTSYLEKPCNLILNQLNIERWNWKKNFNYTKGLKNIQLKELGSKLKYKINFIFNWRVKLKIKNNLKNDQKQQPKGWWSKLK